MPQRPPSRNVDLADENLFGLWGEEGAQQIRLRWAVPPLIALAVAMGRLLGFQVAFGPILMVAVGSALYNSMFALLLRRYAERVERDVRAARFFTLLQVAVDYAAMFLLIHFTGGVWSPLVVLLIPHVILAAIHFSARVAYLLATVAAAGLWLVLVGEWAGALSPLAITYRGVPLHPHDSPVDSIALLTVFTISFYVSAALVSLVARRQEARVQELARERALLTLQLAHSLRAPLGAGLSLLDLVKDGTLGPVNDRQVEILGRIDNRLRDLHEAIGELLTIGKVRYRDREIPDVIVDPNQLAQRAERTFRAQAEAKGLFFEVTAEPGLPSVASGVDVLEKIVENLISNAIKYTEDGAVGVRFERLNDDELRIAVQDTGIGIPEDERDRLFSEFFRASNAKKLTSTGTGLGLALVEQLVDRHEGRLRLSSEEGVGTTVVVDIPFRRSAAVQP